MIWVYELFRLLGGGFLLARPPRAGQSSEGSAKGPVGPGTNGGSAAAAAGPEAVRGGAGERALRVGWAEVPAGRAADCP